MTCGLQVAGGLTGSGQRGGRDSSSGGACSGGAEHADAADHDRGGGGGSGGGGGAGRGCAQQTCPAEELGAASLLAIIVFEGDGEIVSRRIEQLEGNDIKAVMVSVEKARPISII